MEPIPLIHNQIHDLKIPVCSLHARDFRLPHCRISRGLSFFTSVLEKDPSFLVVLDLRGFWPACSPCKGE